MMFSALSATVLALQPVADQTARASLANAAFAERFEPEVQVSGTLLVGVLTEPPRGTSALSPTVEIVGGVAGRLCLRVTSADGRYASRNAYTISGRGAVALPYPSRFQGRFDSVAERFGALAQEGACGGDGAVLPVALSGKQEEDFGDTLYFLLNSGREQVFVRDAAPEEARCTPLGEATGRRGEAFDRVCAVARRFATQRGGEVVLERYRFDRLVAVEAVQLRLAQ